MAKTLGGDEVRRKARKSSETQGHNQRSFSSLSICVWLVFMGAAEIPRFKS